MPTGLNENIYQTLLQSSHHVPWSIDWKTKEFTYVAPQVEDILGWPQSSWSSVRDWIARIHPEDRQQTVEYWAELCEQGTDLELEYRCRHQSGDYIWLRDTIHVSQEFGQTTTIAGLMSDISEQKYMQLELDRIREVNHSLSRTDNLTGVANRTVFEEHLSMEFSRARRNKSSLALLFFDLDDFDHYSKRHGPLMTDKTLLQVAALIEKHFCRPADMVARWGAGTFVALLPETEEMTAQLLAESVRLALFDAKLTHKQSSVADRLTLSSGVAAMSPQSYFRSLNAFVEKSAHNLQRARHSGCNRIFPQPSIYRFLDNQVTEGSLTKHERIRRY